MHGTGSLTSPSLLRTFICAGEANSSATALRGALAKPASAELTAAPPIKTERRACLLRTWEAKLQSGGEGSATFLEACLSPAWFPWVSRSTARVDVLHRASRWASRRLAHDIQPCRPQARGRCRELPVLGGQASHRASRSSLVAWTARRAARPVERCRAWAVGSTTAERRADAMSASLQR